MWTAEFMKWLPPAGDSHLRRHISRGDGRLEEDSLPFCPVQGSQLQINGKQGLTEILFFSIVSIIPELLLPSGNLFAIKHLTDLYLFLSEVNIADVSKNDMHNSIYYNTEYRAMKGKRKGNYTVPFLPVRNTHLTKGYLHIQDWFAAVI